MLKLKSKKTLSMVVSAVQTVLVAALLMITVLSFSYKLPFLARMGLTFYSVVSGSMEPTIPTGSVIYSGRYKVDDLKKGDIITFSRTDKDTGRSLIVTHRIDSVEKTDLFVANPDKKIEKMVLTKFTTKGDANGSVDQGEVMPNQILGEYEWNIPKLGYVANFVQTQNGFILLVVLPAVLLIGWEVISVINHFKKKYEKESREKIEKIKLELTGDKKVIKKTKKSKKGKK